MIKKIPLLLLISLLMVGCSTPGNIKQLSGFDTNKSSQSVDGVLDSRDYGFMSDEGDHFKELVEQGKFLSASKLFNKYEDSYFTETSAFGGETRTVKYENEINKVAKYLLDANQGEFSNVISKVDAAIELIRSSNDSLASKWVAFSDIIQSVEKSKEYYANHRIFAYEQVSKMNDRWNLSSPINALNLQSSEFNSALEDVASREFDRYDFSNDKDFFKEYPIKLNKAKVVRASSKTILKWLNSSSLDEAIALIDKYKLNKSSGVRNKLAGILLDKASRKTYGDKQPKLMDVMATLKQIEDLGVNISDAEIPIRYKASFFQFGSTADFDSVNGISKNNEPYLIVIDKRRVGISRGDEKLEKVYSKYVSGVDMVSNPNYEWAKSSYDNAVLQYNGAVNKYKQAVREEKQYEEDLRRQNSGYKCDTDFSGSYMNRSATTNCKYGVDAWGQMAISAGTSFSGIAPAIAKQNIPQFKSAVDSARYRLEDIPREIKKFSHTEYAFTTKTYDTVKTYEYVIHLVNKVEQDYLVVKMPLAIERSFVIANDLNLKDANHKPLDFQTIDDMKIFASDPNDDISISELMNKLPVEYSLKKYSNLANLLSKVKSSYKEADANLINQILPNYNTGQVVQEKRTDSDYIKDLGRIKKLLDSGTINQDDYETLKQKIINKL
jgi:antitoxin component HigA of HigAB toxin-antitoxin module